MSRQRARATLRIAAAVLMIGAAAPSVAAAADVTVGFDAAPAVAGQSANQVYIGDPGVTFGTRTPQPTGGQIRFGDTCSAGVQALAAAPSPPNVAVLGCGGPVEFPNPPSFLVNFKTSTRTSVSLKVGHTGTGGAHSMGLSAYDEDGKLVAQTGQQLTTTSGTTFTVSAGQPEIRYVLLDEGPGTSKSAVWVDDLTFDTPPVPGKPAFDIERTNSGTVSLRQGGPTKTVDLTLSRLNGSAGDVTYAVTDLPRGVTATTTPSVNGASLVLQVDPRAPLTNGTEAHVTVTPVDALTGTVTHRFPLEIAVTSALTLAVAESNEVQLPSCHPIKLRYSIAPWAGPAKWSVVGALPGGLTATIDGTDTAAAPPVSGDGTAQLRLIQTDRISNDLHTVTLRLTGTTDYSALEGAMTYASDTDVNTHRAGPIDAFPTQVHTPQQLGPGTTVTISGDDLCTDGATNAGVRFGNDLAIVPLSGPQGRIIRAEVPRNATSGRLEVIPDRAHPNVTYSGPDLKVDSYRNSVGFAFHNYKPHLTVDQMTATFGYDATHYSPNICSGFTFGLIDCKISTPIPDPWSRLVLTIANLTMGGGSGGACFGFSRTSQQLRLGRRGYTGFGNDKATNAYDLDWRTGAGGALQEAINANQLAQLSSEYLGFYTREAVGNVLAPDPVRLRQEVEGMIRANDHPLLSIRDGGTFDKLHVVVGYDVYDDPTTVGAFYIDVYDSNKPFGQMNYEKGEGFNENPQDGIAHADAVNKSRIHVMPNGSWSLPSSNMGASSLGNITVGGIDMPPAHPTLIGGKQALADGLVLLLGWSAGGILNQEGAVAPPPSDIAQVTAGGRKLYRAPGVLNADPATALRATPWAPATGEEASADGVLLAAGPGADYQVQLRGERAGEQTRTVIGSNIATQVTTQTRPGVTDTLSVSPADDSVAYATGGTASTKLGVDMMVRAGDGSTRTAQVETTTAAKGEDTVSFDRAKGGVEIEHRGPPTTVRLTLSATGGATLPEAIQTTVPVGRNATTLVKPSSWKQLGESRLTARSGGRTRSLRTHRKGAPGAKVRSLKVTGKGDARTASAQLSVPASVQAGDATVTFAVRRGKRVIGTHSVDAGPSGSRALTWRLPAKLRRGDRLLVIATTIHADGTALSSSSSARQRKL